MKKLFTIIATVALTANVLAQAPQKMSYQAVIRNAGNALVANTTVGMQISILQGSATGTPVYVETQAQATNINGLVTLEIGAGTLVSGSFANIDWVAGPYFIKTETDPSGGTSYTITGTSQLLSVPYALNAATSNDNRWSTNGSDISNLNAGNVGIGTGTPGEKLTVKTGSGSYGLTHTDGTITVGSWIGSNAGWYGTKTNHPLYLFTNNGGAALTIDTIGNTGIGTITPAAKLDVIGKVKTDNFQMTNGAGVNMIMQSDSNGNASWTAPIRHFVGESYGGGIVFFVYDNGQHGLIAATADQGNVVWYNGIARYSGTVGDGLGSGEMNTAMLMAEQVLDNNGLSFAAEVCANYSATAGGITYGDWYLPSKYELNLLYLNRGSVGGFVLDGYYWSSNEGASSVLEAWFQIFQQAGGSQLEGSVANPCYVRPIRAF